MPEPPNKINLKRCANCSTHVPALSLCMVRGKWLCLECGKQELDKWNEIVKEAQ